jgi:hypothetical protein
MVRPDEKSTIPIRYSPAAIIITASKIEITRGTCRFCRNRTMGSMTKAKSNAMVKGRITGAVIFNTTPARITAMKARSKKFALPE